MQEIKITTQEIQTKLKNSLREAPKRIKELREKNGWTQEELANQIDVDRQTINGIENGRRFVGRNSLLKFAHVFNVDVKYFEI